ncbi:GNAT family protein [Mesorhizobium sp. M1252]|uniref:GNAT family N-acetyltransferase n=1 Tax=Mesorhizobium sp. M1252 TaxID=2957073 RepID=UPI0033399A41
MHILETPRLILRPPLHSDELLLRGLYNDPFVVNAVRDGVYPTIEQSKALLLQFINHWQHNRFGVWMLFVKNEGQGRKFAGFCGLMYSGPNMPEDPSNVEIGTCLHLSASGKGIAVEAGMAAIQFAFEHLKFKKVTTFIRPTNTRSIRKNVKLGFFYVGDRLYNNITMRYYEVYPETAIKTENFLVFSCEEPDVIQDK